jgi:8-oxo-dGTP pyrophosphatase MutT (NUDIX family)
VTAFRNVGEREIYAGHVFTLVQGTFEDPDGERFARDIVRTTGAVAVVPIVYERGDAHRIPHVVLVAQYRPAHDDVIIEIPAGMRDVAGEADEDNGRRELAEEVGLVAGRLTLLTEVYASPGLTDATNAIFLATECTPVERAPHGPEEVHAEVLDLPLPVALRWVDDGRIVDSKTVVGLLLADRRLRESGR